MKSYKKKYLKTGAYLDLSSKTTDSFVMEPQETLSENKCLYCYEPLNNPTSNFHQACNKKFFGQLETPAICYNLEDLEKLAAKILQTSKVVTGVQAKISLTNYRKESKNSIRKLTIVGIYGDYILKPPSKYYPQLPELEHLTMKLATVCGLATVPHSLVRLQDNTLCYITKRIDRYKGEQKPMLDMCQITQRITEDKYKGSHEQVAKHLLKYSSNPYLDVAAFYEHVLFSYFVGNADMHLKNFSMYAPTDGNYILTPGYDLLNTTLVNPADKEELALTLNGKKSKLNYNDFLAAYLNCGLTQKLLDKTLENFYYCLFELKQYIENSFLSEDFKTQLYQLIKYRLANLTKHLPFDRVKILDNAYEGSKLEYYPT